MFLRTFWKEERSKLAAVYCIFYDRAGFLSIIIIIIIIFTSIEPKAYKEQEL
jgi:hypothetical protein